MDRYRVALLALSVSQIFVQSNTSAKLLSKAVTGRPYRNVSLCSVSMFPVPTFSSFILPSASLVGLLFLCRAKPNPRREGKKVPGVIYFSATVDSLTWSFVSVWYRVWPLCFLLFISQFSMFYVRDAAELCCKLRLHGGLSIEAIFFRIADNEVSTIIITLLSSVEMRLGTLLKGSGLGYVSYDRLNNGICSMSRLISFTFIVCRLHRFIAFIHIASMPLSFVFTGRKEGRFRALLCLVMAGGVRPNEPPGMVIIVTVSYSTTPPRA